MKNNITTVILLILTFLLGINVHAQWQNGLWTEKQATNWCFGDLQGGIDAVGLNFINGAPEAFPGVQLDISEGSATISDKDGNLLFYAADDKVWNANHQVMLNGDSIHYSAYVDYYLGHGTRINSSTQYGVIIPKPNHSNIYYLFNVNAMESMTNGKYYGFPSPALTYSEIDMNLDNGLGGVTINKNVVLNHERGTEKITAVYHADKNKIWVITHLTEDDDGNHGNRFVAYLITENGIDPDPVISDIGLSYPNLDVTDPLSFFLIGGHGQQGQMKASPDGSRIAVAIFSGFGKGVQVFNFDNKTGKITNPINLDVHAFGLEFSPNSRYLYVGAGNILPFGSTGEALYQYDLSMDNETGIKNSRVNVFDLVAEQLVIWGMQLGSDGKIYVTSFGGNNIDSGYGLDVIDFPNNLGMACGYNNAPSISNFDQENVSIGLPTFNQSYFESGILYEKECFEVEVIFSTIRIPDISAIAWDFGDGQTGSGLTPTHSYAQSGTYTVTATITSNGAQQTATTEVTIYGNPIVATQPEDLVVCDDETGNGVFDLSLQDNVILGGQDPANFTVTYHNTQSDADNNANPITNLTAYTSAGESIYARVTNADGCYVTTSFGLVVEETPEVPAGLELIGCSPFDLSEIISGFPQDYSVSYYEDKEDAENEQGEIAGIEDYIFAGEEIRLYIRVENATGLCNDIGELTLRQGDCVIPQGISPNSDGKNDRFDLTFLTASYKGGHISFFNRYGRVVYEEDDYTDQWHGQDMNGNELPTGTYFYVLELGEAHPEYGKVIKSWVYVQRER